MCVLDKTTNVVDFFLNPNGSEILLQCPSGSGQDAYITYMYPPNFIDLKVFQNKDKTVSTLEFIYKKRACKALGFPFVP